MAAASLLLLSLGDQAFAQYDEKLVVLETNLGTIVIEFFPEDAPNHVSNFIGLAESGFYDETIFHRIIPGFMIQGGDPNTVSGDPSTWGTGGPDEGVDAEFNTIKHIRGIVSMARSQHPDSGGSQFFIVHQNSINYDQSLDGKYSVFGRIVTEESFETLDKIATVKTESQNRPADIEKVKITKATVVDRSAILNLLELSEPERMQSAVAPLPTGNQEFESPEHEVGFSIPEGWFLQEPDESQQNSPDVVAVGPKIGIMNPVIFFTVQVTDEKTFDDLISEKAESIKPAVESGELKIISQEKTTVNGSQAYVTNAEGIFSSNDEKYDVKFKEIMIYDTEKFYIFQYSNGISEFESELPRFEETIDSFKIISRDDVAADEIISRDDVAADDTVKDGGGCLIATATYGSEMSPQVQQLRELRDNVILSTESGSMFMTGFNQFYYSFSPAIADLEREQPIIKQAVKLAITPMLSTLSLLNHVSVDSEQEMLSYGIGIILMNIGMYVAVPAIIIHKIRK